MKKYIFALCLVSFFPIWFLWATHKYGTMSSDPTFIFGALLFLFANLVPFAGGFVFPRMSRFGFSGIVLLLFCAVLVSWVLKMHLPVPAYAMIYWVGDDGVSYTHIVTALIIVVSSFCIGLLIDDENAPAGG